jgi:cytochrome oxidase Cu insertion factor (SCO1/SenC/PrrC family)
VNEPGRARAALAALAIVLATTVTWWAVALWPVGASAPEWLLRTRDVCFGVKADALPTAGGWILLIGQPVGLVALLATVWGRELLAELASAMRRTAGQIVVGVVLALLTVAAASAVERVRTANEEPFALGTADLARRLTRVNDVAPALALEDQAGQLINLASFRGRAVIVTFAYAHCQTVCPLTVSDVLTARDRVEGDPPAVLIVTLDPWRDTPSRLGSIAKLWGLTGDVHVLSGAPDVVERTLDAWRVPRVRNGQTGDLTHPSLAYVVDADGHIAYVIAGNADAIAAAVRAL